MPASRRSLPAGFTTPGQHHFAAWGRHGLRVGFAYDWHGDWPRMLARELRGLPRAPGERRRALAAMSPPRDA